MKLLMIFAILCIMQIANASCTKGSLKIDAANIKKQLLKQQIKGLENEKNKKTIHVSNH